MTKDDRPYVLSPHSDQLHACDQSAVPDIRPSSYTAVPAELQIRALRHIERKTGAAMADSASFRATFDVGADSCHVEMPPPSIESLVMVQMEPLAPRAAAAHIRSAYRPRVLC